MFYSPKETCSRPPGKRIRYRRSWQPRNQELYSDILVDGSDIVQASYARAGVNLSGLVVGETSVIAAGMSAKYGPNGGGVIIQASRPGANEYHGAVTWSHTDPGFNAYPLGSTARSALHQNFYGLPRLDSEALQCLQPHLLLRCLPARPPLQSVQQPRHSFLTPDENRRQPQQFPRRHRPGQPSKRTVRQPRLQGVSPRQNARTDGRRETASTISPRSTRRGFPPAPSTRAPHSSARSQALWPTVGSHE
jgi:hypothetical protein